MVARVLYRFSQRTHKDSILAKLKEMFKTQRGKLKVREISTV